MTTIVSERRSAWRKVTGWYAAFLTWLVAISTAILVLPVALQGKRRLGGTFLCVA